MDMTSTSINSIPQKSSRAERTPGEVAVSLNRAEGPGFPGSSPISALLAGQTQGGGGERGGGASSYSFNTWDQVSKTSLLPCKPIAKSREDYKQALVVALTASGRHSEALLVSNCGEDFKVGKCLDCGCSPAFPISCYHRLCPYPGQL